MFCTKTRFETEAQGKLETGQYTLFQTDGHHFSLPMFTCKLALVISFLDSKFKRIFSLTRGNGD